MNLPRINRVSGSRWLILAAALLMVAICAETSVGCPTCKDNLAADPAAANMIRGYFYSILFMVSMPFLILGGLSSYFYWEVRKARARRAVPA